MQDDMLDGESDSQNNNRVNEYTATPTMSSSSTSSSATPIRTEKLIKIKNSDKVLNQVLSQLEESTKSINQICLLVKKHEELLSGSKSKRARNKHVPIIVRVSARILDSSSIM